jgi:hypothetical protein
MADRARASLADLDVSIIEPQRVTAACPGAGIFLTAEYEILAASFATVAGSVSRLRPLQMKQSRLSASTMLPVPRSSFTSPISYCYRSRS